jgi:hypothetical protein
VRGKGVAEAAEGRVHSLLLLRATLHDSRKRYSSKGSRLFQQSTLIISNSLYQIHYHSTQKLEWKNTD